MNGDQIGRIVLLLLLAVLIPAAIKEVQDLDNVLPSILLAGLYVLLAYMGIKQINPIRSWWIGPNPTAMQEELRMVQEQIETGAAPDGSPIHNTVPLWEKEKKLKQRLKLYEATRGGD